MSLSRGEGRSVGPPNTDEVPAHYPGWASNRGLSSLGGAPRERRRRSLTYSTIAIFTELPRRPPPQADCPAARSRVRRCSSTHESWLASFSFIKMPAPIVRRVRVPEGRGETFCQGRREDKTRYLLGLVQLWEVPRRGQEEQLGVGEQIVEAAGHASVQVGIRLAKDDPHRTLESSHLGLRARAGPHSPPQVGVQREECRLGARRRGELLVEERYELLSYFLVPDKPPADLPPVHPAEEVEPPRDEARHVPQTGR